MRVYADNAATTKLSPAAKEAMLPYFDEIYGNPSTLYTFFGNAVVQMKIPFFFITRIKPVLHGLPIYSILIDVIHALTFKSSLMLQNQFIHQ